jgi:hypothetical protein
MNDTLSANPPESGANPAVAGPPAGGGGGGGGPAGGPGGGGGGAPAPQPLTAGPAPNEGLVDLLTVMNPYTMDVIGEMDFWGRNPNPTNSAGNTLRNMEVEIEKEYPGGWEFKGQMRKVNLALRIKYRYPVRARDQYGNRTGAVLSWITDYLLVGFEDSGP